MLFSNILDYGKSEAGTTQALGAGLVYTIKALEYPLLILRADSDAGIPDLQLGNPIIVDH